MTAGMGKPRATELVEHLAKEAAQGGARTYVIAVAQLDGTWQVQYSTLTFEALGLAHHAVRLIEQGLDRQAATSVEGAPR
jgi:hypothetical protein